MPDIPESIPGTLVTKGNCELDRLNISHNDWRTTRHIHVVGWLLAKWCHNFLSDPFLPPTQLNAVAHSEAISARSELKILGEGGREAFTECVWLFRAEGVEVSVHWVDSMVISRPEHLLRRYRCARSQVCQDVSFGATFGALCLIHAKDGWPGPDCDWHQSMRKCRDGELCCQLV